MESLEQLQKTYALMTDEEIAEVASDADDLTETARQALQYEIAKRGLKIAPKPAPPQPDPGTEQEDEDPDSGLEVVASVRSPQEASWLQAVLNSAAVRSCLGPDNADSVDSFHGNFEKGVDLKVYFPFRGKALSLIDRARRDMPPEFQHDDEPDEEVEEEEEVGCDARCPKCHSEEIVFDGRVAEPGSEPRPDAKFEWHCDACGHVWEDEGMWEDDGMEDTDA
jgi:hypothetical protein